MAHKYSPDLSDWWMSPMELCTETGDDGEGTRDEGRGVEGERNEARRGVCIAEAWLVGVHKGTFTLST